MSFTREPNAEPIPGYRLIEPLGSGGFGEAWKCEAPGGLFKAIKFVFGNLNSLDVDGARAEQELKALERVKAVRHPFVLPMDLIKVVDGQLIIVMELADRNLQDAFEECVASGLVGIPRDTLLRYVWDAAEALDHMNEKHGLQHLDIKPRNLFLVSDHVKVADFGLVKTLERTGASGILGGVTPLYAPPETFSGAINARSDQYSLAIVYQELLTGQRPFNGKNARQLAHQHLHEEPELRALPEAERPLVARALSKDPTRRFPSCLAFVRALYAARTGSSRPPTMVFDGDILAGARPESMENFLLDDPPAGEELSAVDLGGNPGGDGGQMGLTMALPQTGALRPTIVIGVGNLGRRALVELRCRLLDRFGDLDKLPLLRFLYLDADPEAIKNSQRGAPEVAFRPSEVFPLPLQPVSHYRRRQLDQLNDWLPREKLYAMPRSLKPQGSRALGRLAFADNYLRLMARLRREVQQACHPDAIFQTVSQTGLALRDNVPRVYVIGGATGGSSGTLADLGYAVRRLMQQLHHPDAPVTSLLLCGAPEDPATPATEQANLYATLTELNHFSDPYTTFSAQYGTDGPRVVDEGGPFDQSYLLVQEHRTPESRRDTLAHLGAYLFHEITTPLGLRLDQQRMVRGPEGGPFRSLGTHGVWFPRGLLLRLAAREATRRILEEWQAAEMGGWEWLGSGRGRNGLRDLRLGDTPPPEATTAPSLDSLLEAVHARVLGDPDLQPEALQASIGERAGKVLEASPREVLARLLSTIEAQSQQAVALEDPGAWGQQALARIQEWLGSGLQQQTATSSVAQRKSRLTKALETAASQLAEEWEVRLVNATFSLMEHPGRRLALAEAALGRFIAYCDEALQANAARCEAQSERTRQAQAQLQQALESCITSTSGFSWFGSRSRRVLRFFVDHLASFARQCLVEDTVAAVGHLFGLLRGRMEDRLRDLGLCRQRLRHLAESLGQGEWNEVEDERTSSRHAELSPSPLPVVSTESFWESVRESATARVVLPDGETDMERSARRFLATLGHEQWTQLDQAFQDQVLTALGGLHRACLNTTDLRRHLAGPLLNQAVASLGNLLPITDVAQVELAGDSGAGSEDDRRGRMRAYFQNAAPLLRSALVKEGSAARISRSSGKRSDMESYSTQSQEQAFLLIPASESGKTYGEEAETALPGVQLVNVPGQAGLLFCREQTTLSIEDLETILRPCRPAYEEAANVPQLSPHARFDIQDWTPLDP